MEVALIVAIASNRVIGKDNDLVWHLPDDMNYFKETTKGHHVIMGRRNYESIPDKYRPLPGRTNVVVTRQHDYEAEGAIVVNSIDDALQVAASNGDDEPFIIGGGQIYAAALEAGMIDVMHITWVNGEFEGDTYFPEVDLENWIEESREHHPADENHLYSFDIVVYRAAF